MIHHTTLGHKEYLITKETITIAFVLLLVTLTALGVALGLWAAEYDTLMQMNNWDMYVAPFFGLDNIQQAEEIVV